MITRNALRTDRIDSRVTVPLETTKSMPTDERERTQSEPGFALRAFYAPCTAPRRSARAGPVMDFVGLALGRFWETTRARAVTTRRAERTPREFFPSAASVDDRHVTPPPPFTRFSPGDELVCCFPFSSPFLVLFCSFYTIPTVVNAKRSAKRSITGVFFRKRIVLYVYTQIICPRCRDGGK